MNLSSNIINLNKTDYETPSLFLGQKLGLYDTINKYDPKIMDLFRELRAQDWDEFEFNFTSCNLEFKTCPKAIADILKYTLAWLWEADTISSRSIYAITAPFITFDGLSRYWQRVGDNECVTGDHEVLTPKGWKRIDAINENDKVAQWDYNTRSVTFVQPERIISKDYSGELYHFYDLNKNVSQITTPNHRMPVVYPYWSNDGQPQFKTADEVNYHGGNGLPSSGFIASGGKRLSPQERLYIAVQADGSLCGDKYTGSNTSHLHYRFSFSKERKITRLLYLCGLADWRVTEIDSQTDRDRRNFIVYVPISEYNNQAKTFDWFELDQIGYEWAVDFLDEIKYWDGNITSNGKTRYISTNKSCIDKVVALGHLVGHRCHVTVTPPRYDALMPSGCLSNTKECYQVHITNRQYVTGNSIMKSIIDYSGKVYCLTVPTGYFIVRHNNAVSITGNCLHSATYSEILRNSFDNYDTIIAEVLSIKENLSRLEVVSNILDETYIKSHQYALGMIPNDQDLYNTIYLFCIAMLGLERIQFIQGFTNVFAIVAQSKMFIPIGEAVQKICKDEFENHVRGVKTILEIESRTVRGQIARKSQEEKIKWIISEICNAEKTNAEFIFSEGRELVGLDYELSCKSIDYNSQDVYDFLKLELPFERIKKNPVSFMDKYVNMDSFQGSPQEARKSQYLLGAVVNNTPDDFILEVNEL